MVIAANLGFPRIGPFRELKKAVEAYWKGASSQDELLSTAKALRKNSWELQKQAGIELIPSNDFSFYDQVLDTIALVGAVPERYAFSGETVDLDTYFAMARGRQQDGQDVVAMEMTKWFDTNYHYIVPELKENQQFSLSSTKPIDEFNEAKALGIVTRPVLLGPISFLLLGKMRDEGACKTSLLEGLLKVYEQVLQKLEEAGCEHVQIDEPCLVLDLDDDARNLYKDTYEKLRHVSNLNITLTTYFGDLRDNLDTALNLPVWAVHIDLVRGANQLDDVLAALPNDTLLSLGLIDGRNIWKADLATALAHAEKAAEKIGNDRLLIAPSCSLLHTPVDLDNESKLDEELKNWLAFAKQKLFEVSIISRALNDGKESMEEALGANAAANESRKTSERIHNQEVKTRTANIVDDMIHRASQFEQRIKAQAEALGLPLLPTTTIGSFPQTQDIRKARAQFKKGELSRDEYDTFLEEETTKVMRYQDDIGIDVPVHGEYERNDMVEYFGEKLNGFAFTQNGWVQSYGSRGVKPPIIFGDVSRDNPMTIRWSKFAQSLTDKPVKGMLTGPVTILQWSFVRDDQPRETTCKQIGLAIRDEVVDLENAGIKIIQIDEPAFREGLPLRDADRPGYLKWAVESFRLSASGVEDSTQIHTHMCYSEFNDIIDSIADMDADVISIETSRSAMELLDAFVEFKYPNEIGPGVYDIHSPRVPKREEMEHLLHKALDVLNPEQIWVNPDCGLKTRGWAEVEPALKEMVTAAKNIRTELEDNSKSKVS